MTMVTKWHTLTLSRRLRDIQGLRRADQHPSCRPPGWRLTSRHTQLCRLHLYII